ncbi:hypothetical protein [Saccharicrinis sp. FJH54]|uniref:hypothetical protein n=1 Tax=Saccharicrinis sp. FJH54 TaxID=3344665 RepID=UPI0035D43957
MKKITLFILLFTVSISLTYAQTDRDSISAHKVTGGYEFYKSNIKLTMPQLVTALKPNDAAYKQIQSARANSAIAGILGGVGGFLVGYPLGTALAGGDPNWTMAGVGAGLVVISIPISISSNKKVKQAVDIYNEDLRTSLIRYETELRFSMTQNGIGLKFRF